MRKYYQTQELPKQLSNALNQDKEPKDLSNAFNQDKEPKELSNALNKEKDPKNPAMHSTKLMNPNIEQFTHQT